MQIDSDGLQRQDLQAQLIPQVVHAVGLTEVWSMCAYCKFEQYGIQIDAAIDTYSRFVVWTYVGINGRTAVSTLAQYLATLADKGMVPHMIRSGHSAEISLTAGWQLELGRLVRPRVEGEPLIELADCYECGTSKTNQKIQAYWSQQAKATTNRWRLYFEDMVRRGGYKATHLEDRIDFLAIYTPILQKAVREYVEN